MIFALFLLLDLNKQGNYLCQRNHFCILLMCLSRKSSQGGITSDKEWSHQCNALIPRGASCLFNVGKLSSECRASRLGVSFLRGDLSWGEVSLG